MLWRRRNRRSRRHHLRGGSIARAAYTGLSSASLGSSTSVDWRSLFNPLEPQLWSGAQTLLVDRPPLSRAGEGVAQPSAGFAHCSASLVDDANPEHEPVIDPVIAGHGRGYACCLQLLGVELALVAQGVVFGGDHKRERQARQIRSAQR